MRPGMRVELKCANAEEPKASAKILDFDARGAELPHHPRVRALERENAMLRRVLTETRNQIERIRQQLDEQAGDKP